VAASQPFEVNVMKSRSLGLLAVLPLVASLAQAAPPPYVSVDHSTETLVDKATAKAMWQEALPARLVKLYPPKKWGFVSEVEGGFNAAKTCVITARAMMMPLRGKLLTFKPAKTATAFDALPNATNEQCKELARTKLKEAITAVVGGLIAG
jgi:hypothetical protein